jgi:hypothetical protein
MPDTLIRRPVARNRENASPGVGRSDEKMGRVGEPTKENEKIARMA